MVSGNNSTVISRRLFGSHALAQNNYDDVFPLSLSCPASAESDEKIPCQICFLSQLLWLYHHSNNRIVRASARLALAINLFFRPVMSHKGAGSEAACL